mmetsp:Transcript_4581/g.7398  ORF Transcript_4581/g.7398 Transcript_4581/m.7398 type:complete len:118 (-) Transcript_4581:2585-2938(-)
MSEEPPPTAPVVPVATAVAVPMAAPVPAGGAAPMQVQQFQGSDVDKAPGNCLQIGHMIIGIINIILGVLSLFSANFIGLALNLIGGICTTVAASIWVCGCCGPIPKAPGFCGPGPEP